MWGQKHDHSSVTWKKMKDPRPTSQRTVVENLTNALKEVEDMFPRIKPKATTPIP
jgi:hypothetical protein